MPKLKTEPEWLAVRVAKSSREVGVDREAKVIRGFIVAEEGPFDSDGRGEFDRKSLQSIVKLMRSERNGLKSRFTHPTLSGDGLGTFLGRARNPWREQVARPADGDPGRTVEAVRADLYLSATAFEGNPRGNIGDYIMDLAEEDSDAFGASLVLKTKKELRLDKYRRPLTDDDGHELPPLWRPTALHAIDTVDDGDATRSFLSGGDKVLEGLPDGIVREATELLDRQFGGASRDAVEARCTAWLDRYLNLRFGAVEPDPHIIRADALKIRIEAISKGLDKNA